MHSWKNLAKGQIDRKMLLYIIRLKAGFTGMTRQECTQLLEGEYDSVGIQKGDLALFLSATECGMYHLWAMTRRVDSISMEDAISMLWILFLAGGGADCITED